MAKKKLVPELRFPGFISNEQLGNFNKYRFEDIFIFSTGKSIKQSEASPEFEIPCVRYGELYHMYNEVIYEVINKTNLGRSELLFSKGDEILLPSAGEDPLDIGSASALIIKNVAIGRTINILRPKNKSLYSPIFVSYYINQRLKRKISSLAKGVSISNVYNSDLKKLEIILPDLIEQKKIAAFLSATDERIQLLEKKKEALERYKKGVMQKIFNREIRFKDDEGKDFPDWGRRQMKDVLFEHKKKNSTNQISEVFSVAKEKGVINQIEHLGRSYSAESISHYKIAEPFDLVYTKSPTSGYPFGIIKQNLTGRIGVLSPLYAVFKPQTRELGTILHNYFLSSTNTYNYLVPLVQKGAKNTMNINNDDFLNGARILLPISHLEQQKIASFLSTIDDLIAQAGSLLARAKEYKKGLLQKMFV